MTGISKAVEDYLQRQVAETKERAAYRSGVTAASEDILLGLFSDESVARATEAFASRPELPADERMTHALAAALGARIVRGPDGVLSVVPLDEEVVGPLGVDPSPTV